MSHSHAGSSRSWPVLGVGVAVLVGVAAAGRWLDHTSVGDAAVASGTGRAVADGVRFAFVAFFLFGAACLVLVLSNGRAAGAPGAGGVRRRFGLVWTLALLAIVAALLMVFRRFGRAGNPRLQPVLGSRRPTPAAGAVASGPRWGGDWPLILGAVVAAAVVGGLWARARRPGDHRAPSEVAVPDHAEMEVPDRHLDPAAEPDPRRAVVIAYHRLLVGLADRGWARWRSEAPLEHLERVLVDHPAARAPAQALVSTFEQAEYSDHPITDEQRARALTCLAAVDAELDRAATLAAARTLAPAGQP